VIQAALVVGYLLHCAIFGAPLISWPGAFIAVILLWIALLDHSLEKQCVPRQPQ
jgi:hypothetical protein